MPKRFAARCRCCGVPAAQLALDVPTELLCVACEAPQAQYEGYEPLLYGEPIAIVIETMLHVMRGRAEVGRQLVLKWRSGGADTMQAKDLQGISEITGAAIGDGGDPLVAANTAVSGWLLEASNTHVPSNFGLLYERYFVETVYDDPENLSNLGLLESTGLKAHNAELTEHPSEARAKRRLTYVEQDLKILCELEGRQEGKVAPPDQQTSVGILRWMMKNDINGAPFEHHPYALDQMDGTHQDILMLMTDLTPVRSLEDAWNYIQRLRKFPRRFELIAKELVLQKKLGIIPPRFVVEKVLESVVKMGKEFQEAPEESAVFTSLLERLKDDAGVEEVPEDLKLAAKLAILEAVVPAYQSLQEPLQMLLDVVSADGYEDHSGVKSLPSGPEYYRWRLSSETSSSMSPEEVHKLGHEQVKVLLSEMEEVIKRLAPKDPTLDPSLSVSKNMQKLGTDARWLYSDTQEGKDACVEDFRGLVTSISAIIDPLFDIKPKQPLKVQPVPKHMEEGSPAAFYMPPSLDGSRDGVFYVNLGDMSAQYKFGARTLTAHEAIPGHHFQIALTYEMEGLPHFRKTAECFNAFVEGWALYTEKLARELQFYATEPDGSEGYDLLGHFGDELMRAARLVVDTGLHYYGWSREQAIEYMEQNTILAPSDVITEVERYCVLPGQACSYKVGQLSILQLRAELKAKLGEAFDIRAFHHCLLAAGSVPVTMLPEVTAGLSK